jgi:hypothetical protein
MCVVCYDQSIAIQQAESILRLVEQLELGTRQRAKGISVMRQWLEVWEVKAIQPSFQHIKNSK